ncbi:lysyl oxidase homolog 3-like isoform X2 [Mya arenaria]|uniref:lysyl oxidase homolog 3-like isoform X2 n=1 Tax=Mya arenaria TaxID=6604 RepID=UPI0022E87998|nr:lysyl oxidase homolog 3-like isoform X2 [Mya arenaria]
MHFLFGNGGFYANLVGLLCGLIVVISDLTYYVKGQRSTQWSDGDLRLVGGRTEYEGTVLIFHWSRWGAICDDYWDIRDANVVCNELGFAGAKEAPRRSRFGKGRRRVWLSGLRCRGNEQHLTMCYSRGWGTSIRRCTDYKSSAGVVCNQRTRHNHHREESNLSNDQASPSVPEREERPGLTDETQMSTKRPRTTTRKPPATTKKTTTTTTKPTTTTRKTTTSRPTTPPTTQTTTVTTTTSKPTTTTTPSTTTKPTTSTTKKVTTKRTTTTAKPKTDSPPTTTPRVYNQWVYNQEMWRWYFYRRDGSVITSRPDARYYNQRNTTTSSTTTTTTTTRRPPPLPLDNSIYDNNRHDDAYNSIDNNPLFNTVGGENENELLQDIRRHPSSGQSIKEGYVQDAPLEFSDDDIDNVIEPITTLAPAAPQVTAPSYSEFRLAGGRDYRGYKEGRLEVRLAGSDVWGVVCGDAWNFRSAIVTCRHFGDGYARTAHKTNHYGGSNMDKVLAEIVCTGREERLEDCRFLTTEMTPGKAACSNAQSVAGVICDTRLPDLQPDLKAVQESAFLSDRYLYYLQCAYEEGCLSSTANDMYGTNSWQYAKRRLLHFSTIAKNIGKADFRPDVDRSQWEWHACHQHYHSMEAFSHYDIIDSHGNQIAEGHKASFCLEDSACERGVNPKYNCNGFGHQGISVGCQDSYLADIDCQWIDVTDVKPGMYTLKIELNPNMNVPEISYENNVARCNLYFNSIQARVYNCSMDSLL